MPTFEPFEKSTEEPLQLALNTIFDYADKGKVQEIVFEPQRVAKPTETEGIPMPIVSAGSVVLFVFYKVGNYLEHQLSFGDDVEEKLAEQLKKYQRDDWRIVFSFTELGEKAIAYRVSN